MLLKLRAPRTLLFWPLSPEFQAVSAASFCSARAQHKVAAAGIRAAAQRFTVKYLGRVLSHDNNGIPAQAELREMLS